MKKHILSIILLLVSITTVCNAQTDSLSTTFEVDTLSEIDYGIGRKYRHMDRTQIEEKFLLKAGTAYNFSYPNFVFIGVEKKLGYSNSLSAELYTHSSYAGSSDNGSWPVALAKIGYNYFYKAKQRIKNGESANNLIGPYLSLQYLHSFQKAPDFLSGIDYGESIRLTWGIQHRLTKLAFVGLSTGIEYSPNKVWYDNSSLNGNELLFTGAHAQRYSLVTSVSIGLALGNRSSGPLTKLPYWKTVENRLDELSRKMEDDKTMFKFGVNQLELSESKMTVGTDFGIEQKITPSFSLLIMNELSYTNYGIKTIGYQPYVGLRYYNLMNKSIKRGLSGNNLSSSYFAINFKDFYNIVDGKHETTRPENRSKIEILFGVQKKLNKYGFFDINGGISIDNKGQFLPVMNMSFGIGY